MTPTEDPDQLKGVALSLDNLFSQVEEEDALPTAEVTEEFNFAERPVPDTDILVDETGGPAEDLERVDPEEELERVDPEEELERVDPEEELRVRVQVATDSLARAVDGLVAGEGEVAELSRRIRGEAASLHYASTLDPVVDAVERLALAAPLEDPHHVAHELARSLATPAVSAGLAMRLAGARDDARREDLTQACRRLGDEGSGALAVALAEADDRSARRNLVDGLVAMGDDGLKQAELMVQEGSAWGVVRNGVAILGELGGERAVEHLIGTVRHYHPKVRRETLTALARVGGDGAILLVMSKLDDPSDEVRATAVRAATTLGSERTVKALLARLDEEESQDVQEEILRALGQLGDPVVVPAIEKRAVGGFFSRPPRLDAHRGLPCPGCDRHPARSVPGRGRGRRQGRRSEERGPLARGGRSRGPPRFRGSGHTIRSARPRTLTKLTLSPARAITDVFSARECAKSGVTVTRASELAVRRSAIRRLSVKGMSPSPRP